MVYKRNEGFIQFIPLILIGLVILSAFVISSKQKEQTDKSSKVLSESENREKSGDSNSTSVSGSSPASGTPEPKETEKPESEEQGIENELDTDVNDLTDEIDNEQEFESFDKEEPLTIRVEKKNNKFTFSNENFEADSEFPVSVDSVTKELKITTPKGEKIVTILPDSAINNMIAQNVIDQISLGSGNAVEVRVDANGNVFYEISGLKNGKLFGFFSVAIPKTLNVSAQNGSLTNVSETLTSKLLESLSF